MKRSALALVLAGLALAGCLERRPPEARANAGVAFQVDRLFTHDGCTVYRFVDEGYSRYFTRCTGAASAGAAWRESCGKNCTRSVEVPTGGAQ